MQEARSLEEALTTDASIVAFVSDTGAETLACPEGFDAGVAEVSMSDSPLDPFELDSVGNVVAAFVAALSDGHGSAHVNMTEGAATMLLEAFDRRAEYDCIVVTLTEADVETPRLTPVHVELPARFATSKLDSTGRALAINEDMTRMLGWTPEQYVGTSTVDNIHPDDRERAIRSFGELLGRPGGQTRIRQRLRHSDGSWRWLELTHTNLLHTDDPHVFAESLDVSSEMAVTLALQEREELLALLTESLPIGVLHIAATGEIEIVNATWHRLTGDEPSNDLDALLARFEETEEIAALIEYSRANAIAGDLRVSIERDDHIDNSYFDLAVRSLPGTEASHSLVVTLNDATSAVALQSRLEERARVDHLTGSLNRLGFEEELSSFLADPDTCTHITLLYGDLNEFKAVNDTLGHAAGDDLLMSVAREIMLLLGEADSLARLGGDEFVITLRTSDQRRALAIRDQIEHAMACLSISMSIGIAQAEDGDTFDSLVARADRAMYRHKRHVAADAR